MKTRAQIAEARARLVRPEPVFPDLTHRQILTVLSGLVISMFVAALGSTIVTNALPRIAHELHASEASYTWVITATLLTMTASTPIWGKMADRFDRKRLIQGAIAYYIAACWFAGLSQSVGMLIFARALQGIGSGGIMALSQIIIGAMIPPRDRGKYAGYLGASFALATVMGPLIGGAIVDTPFLGWRGIFYAGTPLALFSLVVLHRTLHLTHVPRKVPIDYLGGTLIIGSVSTLLIWVSLAGSGSFNWVSPTSAVMVPLAIVLLCGAILAESRAVDPIIPLDLFHNRTVLLVVISAAALGVSMIGTNVFLGQYFQIGQGRTAIIAGLLTLPLVTGMFLTSLISGKLISATGHWKRYVVSGIALLIVGLIALSRLTVSTPQVLTGCAMTLVGIGIGATNQNLVLVVQNSVPMSQLGVGSSSVAFFRTLGSASGLSILGAIFTAHLTSSLTQGFSDAGVTPPPGAAAGAIPDVNTLPAQAAQIVQNSYATSISMVFGLMIPLAMVGLVLMMMIREVPLRTKFANRPEETMADEEAETEAALEVAEEVGAPLTKA